MLKHTASNLKCCLCGTDVLASTTGTAMCPTCAAKDVDPLEGVSTQETLDRCSECDRWKPVGALPSTKWVALEPESRELLSLCLKRVRGVGGKGAKLIDAKFVWTEEHARRLKVRMELERASESQKIIVRASTECTFVIHPIQCPACAAESVDQVWRAVVQIRQLVAHRRTLFFLEQMIIARNGAEKALNVETAPAGLDVFFTKHDHALKFAELCQNLVPVGKRKESKQLTGMDLQNSEFRFRHTIAMEIAPVCKYDLCILPASLRSSMFGGKGGLVLCTSVARALHFINDAGKRAELYAQKYYNDPFKPIATAKDLVEFIVLDVQRVRGQQAQGAEDRFSVEVARAKDFGENDERFECETHVPVFQVGDVAMGYDLINLADRFEGEKLGSKGLPTRPILVFKAKESKEERALKKAQEKKALKGLGGGEARLWGAIANDVEEAEEAADTQSSNGETGAVVESATGEEDAENPSTEP